MNEEKTEQGQKAPSAEDLQKKLESERKKLETKRKALDKARKEFDDQQAAVDAIVIELPKQDPREAINGYLKSQNRNNRNEARRRAAIRQKEMGEQNDGNPEGNPGDKK